MISPDEVMCDIEQVLILKERIATRRSIKDSGNTPGPFTVDPDLISKIITDMEVYSMALSGIRHGMSYQAALELAVIKVHHQHILRKPEGGSDESVG
jgi:hypothetical protein